MVDDKPIATIEKTTTESTKLAGEAATAASPPASPAADDYARKSLALAVVAQFIIVVGYTLWASHLGQEIKYAQLVLGGEIGFMTTVLNYYYGSSSGSTAKDLNRK